MNASYLWIFQIFHFGLASFLQSLQATKFCEISTLLLSRVHTDKSKVEISQNFVAFSEYMNFKCDSPLALLSIYFVFMFEIMFLFKKIRFNSMYFFLRLVFDYFSNWFSTYCTQKVLVNFCPVFSELSRFWVNF